MSEYPRRRANSLESDKSPPPVGDTSQEAHRSARGRPHFKKQYSVGGLGLVLNASGNAENHAGVQAHGGFDRSLKPQPRSRHKGFHNPISSHSPDDPIPPFSQPIKPRFSSLNRTPSSTSVFSSSQPLRDSQQQQQQQHRKGSRAGSLFKRLAGMKMTNTNASEPSDQELASSNPAAGPVGIRRKMSTLIHGNTAPGTGPGQQGPVSDQDNAAPSDVSLKMGRNGLFTPSAANSRRGSTASVITAPSGNSSPSASHPNHVSDHNANGSSHPQSDSSDNSDRNALTRSASYFLLDTDLNNLSDITNVTSKPAKVKSSTKSKSRINSPKPAPQETEQLPLKKSERDTPQEAQHSKAQWIAPESWDIDEEVGKPLPGKSKRRTHRHHVGPAGSKIDRERAGGSATGAPRAKRKEGTPKLASLEEVTDQEHGSAAKDTEVPKSSAESTASLASTNSKVQELSEATSSTSEYEDEDGDEDHLRADSMDSMQTLDSDPVKNDEAFDKVGYELDKYYSDFSDMDPSRRYAIRVFNTDETFTTLSLTPNTTVQEMIPQLKRKFNVGQGNYQVSLKVAKILKVLRPTARPILIQRKLAFVVEWIFEMRPSPYFRH